jgi:hypothetical protein
MFKMTLDDLSDANRRRAGRGGYEIHSSFNFDALVDDRRCLAGLRYGQRGRRPRRL